jgi:decaprenylphospho-beta-D-ribofuranose 2-oxidase
VLSGWGRTAPTATTLVAVADQEGLRAALGDAPPRGVIARGLGRSYGDAAQNAGGAVLDMTTFDVGARSITLDPTTGVVLAGSAVTIDALLRFLVPRGFFVPATPGTRHVTVGGAVAADVHGKNHHVDGSWMDHVVDLTLVTPDGAAHSIDRERDPDAFWATGGGLGLTGVVTSCSFRAPPIETSRMIVDTTRLDGLDAVLAAMSATSRPYVVAWIDTSATGAALGRGVLTEGEHASRDALDDQDPPTLAMPRAWPVPPVSIPIVNPATITAAGKLRWMRAPRRRRDELQTLGSFFYPLDAIDGWNRLYGRRGLVQWQCVVPLDGDATLRAVLATLAAGSAASFVTVLKRLGPANRGPLSFSMAGWTLAVDIPAATPALAGMLDRLDRLVVDAGGRIYLVKDARMAPELVPAMYPRLDEWRAVRDRLDPDGVLQSDLARRLDLVGRGRQRP